MAYTAKQIANFLLELADVNGTPISPLKLQKLIYYAHGWHLALTNVALIREPVEAWPHGPVVPVIYHEFKKFGSGPITELCLDDDLFVPRVPDGIEHRDARSIIRKVWEVYVPYNALQLSAMTHAEGSPWSQVIKNKQGTKEIPNTLIKEYFVASTKQ